MEAHHVMLQQHHKHQHAQTIHHNRIVMLDQDVLGLMLEFVLHSQNVKITQFQQRLMQLNAILKIQHVFQEQLQDQQFHVQQEHTHVQMLQIQPCVPN
jgi:hypothetical protein